ncbi:MAG: MarR family winged helix-turn-helix transcriptional regulator [Chloroflexota bacterium]
MATFDETLFIQLSLTCTETKSAFAQHIGLSQVRMQLLMLLSHGETSHAVLQQRLVLDGATLTRQVKQFETEGVVSRRLDPQDNRYTLVALTPAGQQMATGLIEALQTFQTQLLDGISAEEQAVALRVLARVRTNIRHVQEGEN